MATITNIRRGGGGRAAGNFSADQLGDALGMSISMNPTPAILVRDFDRLGMDIRSYKEPLSRVIRQVVVPSVKENFAVGGRPAWAPSSEVTLEWKAADGYGSDVLVRKGNLRRTAQQINIWTVTQEEAYVSSLPNNVWYGKLHQEGYTDKGKRVPARPFIMLQPTDLDKIDKVFDAWLGERIAASGFG